jgi:hypothetical protein
MDSFATGFSLLFRPLCRLNEIEFMPDDSLLFALYWLPVADLAGALPHAKFAASSVLPDPLYLDICG